MFSFIFYIHLQLCTSPIYYIYIYSHLFIYIYLQSRTGPFYLSYLFFCYAQIQFIYLYIIWFNIKIKFMTNKDLIWWLKVWPWRFKWVDIITQHEMLLSYFVCHVETHLSLGYFVGHVETHLSSRYFVGHVETHLSLGYFVGHVETHLSWLTTTKYNKYNTFIIVGGVNLGDLNELLAHLS